MFKKYKSVKERFFSYVTKTKTCWIWHGYKNEAGYGLFSYKGLRDEKATPYKAHRVSLILSGKELGKYLVDHKCRNRSCVNPKHLRLVTHRQNTLENSVSNSAKNFNKVNCLKGHKLPIKNKGNRRVCRKCQNYRNIKRWEKNKTLPSFKYWDGLAALKALGVEVPNE